MANGNQPGERDPNFSFATRELREAHRAQPLALADTKPPRNGAPSAGQGSGFDPYNTSGSFDRRNHWERVRKR